MAVLFERFISQRAQRAARHRRRLRARAPRGGHPVHLRRSTAATAPRSTAVVISYRPKSAIRDVGKALGIAPDDHRRAGQEPHLVGRRSGVKPERIAELGLSLRRPGHPAAGAADRPAASAFRGTCRQHPGGFVLTKGRCRAWCRSRTRPCRTAPSSSGTRTTSMRWACSRSTCWRWACSPPSASASTSSASARAMPSRCRTSRPRTRPPTT